MLFFSPVHLAQAYSGKLQGGPAGEKNQRLEWLSQLPTQDLNEVALTVTEQLLWVPGVEGNL